MWIGEQILLLRGIHFWADGCVRECVTIFFSNMSKARSTGTLVNRETTSRETKTTSSGKYKFVSFFKKSKLLWIWLKKVGKVRLKISCKNFAKLCSRLPDKEIIILRGIPDLWISGNPYALSSTAFEEFSMECVWVEMYSEFNQRFSIAFRSLSNLLTRLRCTAMLVSENCISILAM